MTDEPDHDSTFAIGAVSGATAAEALANLALEISAFEHEVTDPCDSCAMRMLAQAIWIIAYSQDQEPIMPVEEVIANVTKILRTLPEEDPNGQTAH